MSDDLLERALNAYHAEYHRHWRDGGDAQDHDEAHRCGLEAVLVLAGALPPAVVQCATTTPITGRRREENA